MSLVEEIVAECLVLAGAGNLGLAVTLGILLVASALIVLGRKVGDLKLPPPTPEVPPPDAVWSDNVVPGPPGGTDDQIQGG